VFHEKDSYGKHGKDEFRDRFGALGGHCLECYSITADEARSKVSEFLAKYGVCSKLVGVLVIGYGNTLRKTVEELIAQQVFRDHCVRFNPDRARVAAIQ